MNKISIRKTLRVILICALCLFLSVNALALFVIWKPRQVITRIINHLSPNARFSADAIFWKDARTLVVKNAQVGNILKIPKVTLTWEWKRLWYRHFKELRISTPQIFVDIRSLSQLGGDEKSSSTPGASSSKPWFLDRLVLERGGLIVIGLGSAVPSLQMEIDGEFDHVPLGENLSKEDRERLRFIKLNNIHIHSPADLAVTLLKIESVILKFNMEGLHNHELDSLIFNEPTLDIDRGFFWFVEDLRRAKEARPAAPPPTGPEWKVKLFQIVKGKLDINRLREISIQYPFNFEKTQKNMPLSNLSLADFRLDLDIPQQDLDWPAKKIYLQNIRGKIDFNLGEPQKKTVAVKPGWKPSNDVVNTLYVDAIRWEKLIIDSGWVSLTFEPNGITGMYGGSFANGYINGGLNAGWSGNEAWRAWGSADDINAKVISDAFSNESFGMNGNARFAFDVQGHKEKLTGDLKLTSLSEGVMEIKALDNLMNKIEKNTIGFKKEILQAFVSSLRDYPYLHYQMDAHYDKPNATLTLRSDGERGSRQLDVYWHGLKH